MVATVLKIVFVLIGLALLYRLFFADSRKGLTLFEMHFKQGRLVSHKGKIPEKFERECRAIAKAEKLTCTVRAERLGDVRLHVSANVGETIIQRLRNLFPFEYYDKKTLDNSKQTG
ncbi:DUF3634 family protein [Shewanella cyperi]|uniref:DUF3634 family protein n=1 Tax=Shewanella cyperi TaxID=2814292 RepID=A0A974XNW5_9GAMM|nr:DUF3634 family protein [Shewanella cyperi]QSX30718.1 DUF3634 family protein [Shewanella cyperi]